MSILNGWTTYAARERGLMPTTHRTGAVILKHYLRRRPIARKFLQLAGVVALQIASQCCEVFGFPIPYCEYTFDEAYTLQQVHACRLMWPTQCRHVILAIIFATLCPQQIVRDRPRQRKRFASHWDWAVLNCVGRGRGCGCVCVVVVVVVVLCASLCASTVSGLHAMLQY